MNLYIHEWPDNSATVMFDNDVNRMDFNNINQAIEACSKYINDFSHILIQQHTTRNPASPGPC